MLKTIVSLTVLAFITLAPTASAQDPLVTYAQTTRDCALLPNPVNTVNCITLATNDYAKYATSTVCQLAQPFPIEPVGFVCEIVIGNFVAYLCGGFQATKYGFDTGLGLPTVKGNPLSQSLTVQVPAYFLTTDGQQLYPATGYFFVTQSYANNSACVPT
jgi:hypothetical protein